MDRVVHLLRHGEAHNPEGIVYASSAGHPLTSNGRRQAAWAAERVGAVGAVSSSPLERALETATIVADRARAPLRVDPNLGEWRLSDHWAGLRWDALGAERPGELLAYLEHPEDLDFTPEPLAALVERMGRALDRALAADPDGDVVVVSHQDPLQALRLHLTGRPMSGFHHDKPDHASIITLRPGRPWVELGHQRPPG